MDDNKYEDNYLKRLEDLQKSMPNIVLPSSGLIDNMEDVDINGSEFFSESKEEYDVK